MRRWTDQIRYSLASRNRKVLAIVATLAVFGGIIAVTATSNAATNRRNNNRAGACQAAAQPEVTATTYPRNGRGAFVDENGVTQNVGDGQASTEEVQEARGRNRRNQGCTPATPTPAAPATTAPADEDGDGQNEDGDGQDDEETAAPPAEEPAEEGTVRDDTNGLAILGDDCSESNLGAHTGFQEGNKCVDTEFGEVGSAANNPSLLITSIPNQVDAGEPFTISVSTRNLVRDRFLGAAAGGYYLESSFLNDQGLVRGHFHTACRVLASTNEAPDAAPAPAFFVATEDGGGGNTPDTVDINVPGIAQQGTVQCAVWAGDGSHRLPMMERANQTPAFDVARLRVG